MASQGVSSMNRFLRFGWWLSAVLAVVSCGVPSTRYYTIEMPRVAKEPGGSTGRRILVRRLSADQVLVDDRILYRERPNEVAFYAYKRWANPPVDIVTNYIAYRLEASGDYAGVSASRSASPPDLVLRGRLLHFEEVDRGKEVYASVAMALELTDAKTQVQLWRGEADCTRPVAVRDMSGVVNEISGCLEETVSKLLDSMSKELEKAK